MLCLQMCGGEHAAAHAWMVRIQQTARLRSAAITCLAPPQEELT